MAKPKVTEKKKSISNTINSLLETDIDWTKLSNKDLEKVVQLVNHMDEIALRVAKRKARGWAQEKANGIIDAAAEALFR